MVPKPAAPIMPPNPELWWGAPYPPWRQRSLLENELYPLVESCAKLLSEKALFMLINSYTTGLQPAVLNNMLTMTVKKHRGGSVAADEIVLPVTAGGVLPCGASGRWQGEPV